MISVSNIERFATHDGPGIRTTVFLKGCPLHCPWCANPETWTVSPVVMQKEAVCVHCHACENSCPKQAIRFEDNRFRMDRTLCDACGKCVRECLPGSLSINGSWMKEEDVIKTVLRDRDYYEESGGGVTFSGGEPLFQKEGIMKLLRLAKDSGLHTAVETTGVYEGAFLEEVEPMIDLFLFDIKHVQEEKLFPVTGAPWNTVKENFAYLCAKRGGDVIARVPVIPGFNRDDLEEILSFIKQYTVRSVNLLPYHSLGAGKWRQLQKEYRYEGETAMRAEELKQYEDELVSVGG